MSVTDTIRAKLNQAFTPSELRIENESHMHAGPAAESHFKLTVVSDRFASLTRVQRHQVVYKVLAGELQGGVHALALHLYTPREWSQRPPVPASPDCRGG